MLSRTRHASHIGSPTRRTGEMVDAAFYSFTAIPASASGGTPVRPKRPWHEVLGVSADAPRQVIEERARR